MRRQRQKIAFSLGSVLSALWGWYSNLTGALELPEKAGSAARFFADPPLHAPWLVLGGFAALTAWAFWPKPDQDGAQEAGPIPANTGGDMLINNASNYGVQHFGDNII
jgi:hypothetical protein